jgi:hypothetical protein
MCGGRSTVQLQGIWDSELSSKLSERVLDPAQSDVTRRRLIGRKNPAFRLPRLFKLNVPEQSDDALAQRHKPASFECLALGVEIKRALPVDVLQAHSHDFPVSQARVQHDDQNVFQRVVDTMPRAVFRRPKSPCDPWEKL